MSAIKANELLTTRSLRIPVTKRSFVNRKYEHFESNQLTSPDLLLPTPWAQCVLKNQFMRFFRCKGSVNQTRIYMLTWWLSERFLTFFPYVSRWTWAIFTHIDQLDMISQPDLPRVSHAPLLVSSSFCPFSFTGISLWFALDCSAKTSWHPYSLMKQRVAEERIWTFDKLDSHNSIFEGLCKPNSK